MAGSEIEAPQPREHEVGIYTETLARLYLKQGFVEHALAIYRRLAQEQPDNQQLHACLHTIEQQLACGAQGPDVAAPLTAPHAAGDTASGVTQYQEQRVLTQLQRWLHYLQQQRQRCGQP
jgi:hypothetical protein